MTAGGNCATGTTPVASSPATPFATPTEDCSTKLGAEPICVQGMVGRFATSTFPAASSPANPLLAFLVALSTGVYPRIDRISELMSSREAPAAVLNGTPFVPGSATTAPAERVDAVPKPRFVRAVAGLATSLKLAAFCRELVSTAAAAPAGSTAAALTDTTPAATLR